ncbi:MAG: TonB-dependent receptor [Cyclobacteriaceae bacterium]
MTKALLTLILLGLGISSFCQSVIQGTITDPDNEPISQVSIVISDTNRGTTSNNRGAFRLRVPDGDSVRLVFRHIQFETTARTVILNADQIELNITMTPSVTILDDVSIEDSREEEEARIQAGSIEVDAKTVKNVPSAFSDFNRILVTLPGVVSNNELSSTYSVRGGNFDENLVYVNDIQIYRPFLVRAGQQEGLSFVNPDLVQGVNFSAGGWQAKYGDKLSSSLNITYKQPKSFAGSGTVGALGGSVHLEGISRNNNISSVIGIRHKNARLILNTLDTDGEYLPKFTDLQSFTTFDLSKNNRDDKATSMNLLLAYSKNRYLIEPDARETDFGTFNQAFRLFVAFDGREISEYDTYQAAVKLNHKFSNSLATSLITSVISTKERELFEVEGGYRLCDLDKDPNSTDFNKCAVVRGIGTDYNFGRNTLDARLINIDSRSTFFISENNRLEFGAGYSNEDISDNLNEYNFTDSANFSTIQERFDNQISLNTHRLKGYLQNTTILRDSVHFFTYGLRLNYWSLNDELHLSPRFQYALQPNWQHNTIFRLAIGKYVQPPFYRELRNRLGQVNTSLKAQVSWHYIAGIDHIFNMWGRQFKFLAEGYYKEMNNIIPYDIDNIRLRYFGENSANAYASGLDFRVNGEFIEGVESWFSLGILKTEENLKTTEQGFVRRPSDQRVNIGIFFQDHLPNDPSWRVALSFLYGSGLPFGPPNNDDFRNSFNGEQYMRADLRLSKFIQLEEGRRVKSILIGLDILNLFGVNNTISYTWISDLNRNQFAVPNTLSQRFFNVKMSVNF